MIKHTHILNGQNRGVPRNWQDLQITCDFLNRKESGAINVTDLAFVKEANKYLQKRILDGITGGNGIFEGDPYQILLGNPDSPQFTFDGYLDFSDDITVLGKEEIVVSLKKKKSNDWLSDNADGISFPYLYDQGKIKNSDFIKVGYVINHIPDGVQLMTLSLAIYMMTKEIIENVENVAEAISQIVKAAVPDVGTGIGAAAGTPPAPVVTSDTTFNLGEFIYTALKILAKIAYTVAITFAISKLMEQLFEQLLPKKRYHLGMRIPRLFEVMCEHFELSLDSKLIQQDCRDWVYIPKKDRAGGSSGERGYPENNGPIYTPGDLIRVFMEMLNADYRIRDGVFMFERKDQFKINSSYTIPSFFNNQERKLQQYKLNTSEIFANYNINYLYDVQDQNTLDDQTGRIFQAITSAVSSTNPEFKSIKNLKEIDIPFALGKTKTGLTDVEKVLRSLAGVVDGLTGIFGGGTNYKSKIEERRGSLLLSSNFITVGKLIVVKGSQIAENQRELLGADTLWDKYHFINSFALYKGHHNQYYRFLEVPVPMSLAEFASVVDNNSGVDDQGNEYEIEKLIYTPEKGTAKIDYRIKKQYTNNLKIETVK